MYDVSQYVLCFICHSLSSFSDGLWRRKTFRHFWQTKKGCHNGRLDDTQHNGIQTNNKQHNIAYAERCHAQGHLCWVAHFVMLSVIMLYAVRLNVVAPQKEIKKLATLPVWDLSHHFCKNGVWVGRISELIKLITFLKAN